jgi:hypothetical protein
MFQGIATSADPVYLLQVIEYKNDYCKCFSKELEKEIIIETGILKPLLKGKNIRRFNVNKFDYVVLLPYEVTKTNYKLMDLNFIKEKYPNAYEYLNENKKRLQDREGGKMKIPNWYAFIYPKNMHLFESPKLMTQVLASKASFTYDDEGKYYFVGGGNAGGYGIKLKPEYEEYYYYLLGILNSSSIDKYLRHISTQFKGGFYSYAKRFIEKLPIYIPDLKDKDKFEKCKKIEEFVKQILEFKKQGKDKDAEFLESKIDGLVYTLYGLTEEEIKVVEGAG